MAISLIMGMLVESLFIRSHLIIYIGTASTSPWPPPWVLLLWPLFAITLPVWQLKLTYVPWQILVGSTCALAYAAGVRAGAARFPHPAISLSMMAVTWSGLLPLLVWLSKRLRL